MTFLHACILFLIETDVCGILREILKNESILTLINLNLIFFFFDKEYIDSGTKNCDDSRKKILSRLRYFCSYQQRGKS